MRYNRAKNKLLFYFYSCAKYYNKFLHCLINVLIYIEAENKKLCKYQNDYYSCDKYTSKDYCENHSKLFLQEGQKCNLKALEARETFELKCFIEWYMKLTYSRKYNINVLQDADSSNDMTDLYIYFKDNVTIDTFFKINNKILGDMEEILQQSFIHYLLMGEKDFNLNQTNYSKVIKK